MDSLFIRTNIDACSDLGCSGSEGTMAIRDQEFLGELRMAMGRFAADLRKRPPSVCTLADAQRVLGRARSRALGCAIRIGEVPVSRFGATPYVSTLDVARFVQVKRGRTRE